MCAAAISHLADLNGITRAQEELNAARLEEPTGPWVMGAPKGKREKLDPERTFSQIFADFR